MLMTKPPVPQLNLTVVREAAERAARAIPPLWPLESSVAVNPFLGQTGEPLAMAAARLRRVAGAAVTMPRTWYAERIASGELSDVDLAAAIDAAPPTTRPLTIAELKRAAQIEIAPPQALPTVAELASAVSGFDWTGFVAERISAWASGYFDRGQALWAAPKGPNAYAAWRLTATHDLTPEIFGLTGFAADVAAAPESADAALIRAVEQLGLSEAASESYFHRLLISLGGWAQLARYRLWQAELSGSTDTAVTDLIAIRAVWDSTLLRKYQPQIAAEWTDAINGYVQPLQPTEDDHINAILQDAVERAAQRKLQTVLAASAQPKPDDRPALQMAFCIDVRSEPFRRALESLDPRIRTLGFGGFFGLPIAHRRFASDVVEARLPVLLPPRVTTSCSGHTHAHEANDRAKRVAARAKRAWGRFKLAAISSFAFVESMGPVYVAKLLSDGLRSGTRRTNADPAPQFDPPLALGARVDTAEAVLRAMSLTGPFAPLVLIAGHGASVVNNPHASALHCGACGGFPGDVNARLLAGLLNDPQVRTALIGRDIAIPADTLFVGALHDTTTDAVTLYDADHPSPAHASALAQTRDWLATAGALTRSERALRLPRAATGGAIARRARDWAEVRPEWALAGCRAFIAAPRPHTSGRDLQGQAFLHDYDWRKDTDFSVLELILTAPVVVASWISLQYYGSTVAPETFGAGNKLLHNVTGGIGVVEGNGGLLRAGLPWQSVHDGERLVHQPLRLSVLIEAPHEAISTILDRYPEVRALFDNRWLHLFALDDDGRMNWRYVGDGGWEHADNPPTNQRVASFE
ncbi:hypothetical protein I8G32_03090 [Rhodopseudomonas palustris]|uniref:Probable inorganic carbon transporter subunit DabA n=2 Tax=Rhodopseudomonas palustris (strain ATCC BAA-98 / CGA009) TaxID=258594 RepID=DABA_RHOPA|nr:DUF2309 domain-containing protein [Rhodopseudomonas palustris]Q6N5H8.1 RecName: Full=Probable inorganic carbon transporter subunit DabA [Rhodopseudomonas palustris CGA009]OPF93591.1 hypothetical protein B1S06_10375 [Rhodopseudomonas palustris]QQM04532.1 hypothetical protein I8G32_03090 [Rhodopseudomonas palustris]RJF66500.1 DUF2309 domain-containing protein [Rhodopseudomonas palustris]WAB75914.1 DUF2309 domain-containing protein [Rhodopseudomonas palustris]WCL93165.1 DUF2309 domain-contain